MAERYIRFSFQGGVYNGRMNADDRVERLSGPPYAGGVPTGRAHNLSDVRLLAPVVPGKIVCVGLNYAAHVRESQSADDVPTEPVIFMKPPSAVVGPDDAIVRPDGVERVDYEGELAFVIGERARDVTPDKALDCVVGWTILNDVTARALQKQDIQWTRAKGFDTFCPIGPWIVTELDHRDARLTATVNGEIRQDSSTKFQIFPPPVLLSFISRVMTLDTGDVVSTGTPAGIGPMADGDIVEISIEGIGTLRNGMATS